MYNGGKRLLNKVLPVKVKNLQNIKLLAKIEFEKKSTHTHTHTQNVDCNYLKNILNSVKYKCQICN